MIAKLNDTEDSDYDVSIVIVTMNHLRKLKNLLVSIYQMGETNFSYEVILVDNCSNDRTVAFVSDNYPEVKITVNKKIHGFAYNNNLGASIANGEYIFICNPDVVLIDNSLEKLFTYSKNNPKSAIVCPKLLNNDYTYQPSIRKFHSLKILFWRLLSGANDNVKNKAVDDYLLKDFNKNAIQSVDWAMGAAMVIKKELYLKLNGFDEKFFLYVEDEDICLRAWKMDYQVTYYPEAVMMHDHQRSSAKKINKLTWFHFQSFVYFIRKHNLLFKSLNRDELIKSNTEEELDSVLDFPNAVTN